MRLAVAALIVSTVPLSDPAEAGLVTLGVDPSLISVTSPDLGVQVRYRVSQTNWDQAILTSSTVNNNTIAATGTLGNNAQLNGAIWDFVMSYDPLLGITWSLTHAGGGSPTTGARTLQWTAPVNGESPIQSHNALQLYVKAGSSMPGGISSAAVDVSNLSFSATGMTNAGSLADMNASWTSNPGSQSTAWIVSDTDLVATAWALSGRVRIAYQGSTPANLDERLRFDVSTHGVAAIPAPSALTAIAGLLAVARRRRPAPRR
jgi:hypothetical protein